MKSVPWTKGAGTRNELQFANRKEREHKTDPNLGTERNGDMKQKDARKREAIFRFRSLSISVRDNVEKALKGHEKVSRVTTRKLKNVPCLRVLLDKRPVHKTNN